MFWTSSPPTPARPAPTGRAVARRRFAVPLTVATTVAAVGAALLPPTTAAAAVPHTAAPAAVPQAAPLIPAAATPAAAGPPAPTIEQLLADVATALADPVLQVDAFRVTAEFTLAGSDLLFGSYCTAAGHLRAAATILQADIARAPASLKLVVQGLAEDTVRLERDVVADAPEGCDRPDVFSVDTQLKPSAPSTTDAVTGRVLPIGAIDDGSDVPMEIISNTLLLETNQAIRLSAFLARFGGTVVETITADPADADIVQTQYVIQMDPARLLDTSRLAADLEALDPGWGGDVYLTSDQQTARVIATAARAQLEGYEVELELVGRDASIETGTTLELPGGVSGPPGYVPDAFTWDYFRDGSVQDVEVTTAWQLLRRTGLDANKVKVGIIDRGFSRDSTADLPSNRSAIDSGGLSTNAYDRDEDGGWHGALVADTLVGQVDNGQSAAGVAGPVAGKLTTVNNGDRSFRSYTRGFRKLNRADADITNVSRSYEYKRRFKGLAAKRFERVLRRANDNGMVIFASAGNDNLDIDARKCRRGSRGCRERSELFPCEANRVICVGALADNSIRKAGFSNYGGDVDIWAPGERIWANPTPDCGGCTAQRWSGTSAAAPFAAGVAALIKAANPSLSAGGVWDVMLRTARNGSDGFVTKYVYAGGAVRDAIPGPFLRITAPTASVAYAPAPRFTVDVYDDGLGTPTVTWTRNGTTIGTGASTVLDIPIGTSTVTATASFPNGTVRTATTTVRRLLPGPVWGITTPAIGSSFTQTTAGQGITFATSPNGPGVQWFLDGSTTPFATGSVVTGRFPGLSVGNHTVTARVSDGTNSVQRTLTITITADPAVRTSVTISSPTAGQDFASTGRNTVPLRATARDTMSRPASGCPTGWTSGATTCTRPSTGTISWTVTNLRTGAVVARATGASASVVLSDYDRHRATAVVTTGGTTVATSSVDFTTSVILL